ncbi:uncharacterized protein LOC120091479 isoform X3 [Benincasa hispida]|uniref:uncharacterized protein LOC120091479 isoform X3 n=1 Tax=Benincasa hispida TaxID=102211 RepID=UPI001902922E|nr:uncharacterized protein LOC120091479 isoform X3 [Benincasa hispida]
MSEKKASDGSSFSFTSDLFGTRDTSDLSSTHIFGPIYSSSFKASQHSEVGGKSKAFSCSLKTGTSEYKECKNQSTSSREMDSFYQEQRTDPCHLSSSIYYGGRDVYTQNPGTGFNSSLKRDGGEDDSGGASRGNWWQGSLYY